jgi:hypothetical protein
LWLSRHQSKYNRHEFGHRAIVATHLFSFVLALDDQSVSRVDVSRCHKYLTQQAEICPTGGIG